MTKWQETALVFMLVGITVAVAGHVEGLVVLGCALLMFVGGDPVS